jgi:hypothetical protein
MRSGISAGPPVDSLSLPNQPADNFIVGVSGLQCLHSAKSSVEASIACVGRF